MSRRLAPGALLAGVVLVAAACGAGGDTERRVSAADEADDDSGWASQVLEVQPGADSPVVLAADGEQITVTTTTEDGSVLGFATDEEGRFLAGTPLETGVGYLTLGGVARLGDGWFALGSGGRPEGGDELRFEIRVFRSPDGRSWSAVEATGLEVQGDVSGLVATDDGLVGVGSLRPDRRPALGPFRPVAWHSRDGEHWTTVPLPVDNGQEGWLAGAAAVGDEVLAVGAAGDRGALWSSSDGGVTWSREERAGIRETGGLVSIAAQGDTLVVSGSAPYRGEEAEASAEAERVVVRSTDGGQTWSPTSRPPPSVGLEADYGSTVTGAGGQFFTVTSSSITGFDDPERCYADLDLCLQDSAEVLYASADGDVWQRIDTSGIGEGEAGEVWTVGGPPEGPLVALTGTRQGIATWSWPADQPLPTEAEPTEPTTDVVVLGESDPIEPGATYGVPLYIHCGMDWLFVGGEAWQRTDGGPDIETGAGDAIDPGWPVAQQTIFGFATLGEDGVIEYSIGDGEVIATYERTGEEPPGCE
jgi:hypothetical protein